MDLYIKLTKNCNLKCAYCFEQEHLRSSEYITVEQMACILRKVKSYCLEKGINVVNLVYTGGEVLLLGERYLESLLEFSNRLFAGSTISLRSNLQTNLTLMNERFVDLIKEYGIKVSSSFDVVGNNRTFAGGESIYYTMIDKMILLLENGVVFSCIVVVTKDNCREAEAIYDFFSKTSMSFNAIRLDPCSARWCLDKVITDNEYIQFLKELAELHVHNSNSKIRVPCIDDYVNLLTIGPGSAFQCIFSDDIVARGNLFVEPNGDIYPCSSLRYGNLYMGNIFTDSIHEILGCEVLKHISRRSTSVREKCSSCEYYGLCNDGCIAFAHKEGDILLPSVSDCRINLAMFPHIRALLHQPYQ